MDERIERRPSWMPWAIGSLLLVIVAMLAYDAGVQHDGAAATAHSHWGFPGIFGFFFLFWVLGAFRWMFWGGCGYGRPWRSHRYYRMYDDDGEWREWHRREHQRMDGSRGPIT